MNSVASQAWTSVYWVVAVVTCCHCQQFVDIKNYPYMVSVYYRHGYVLQRCTGTFVTNQFVLTSGICFDKYYKRSDRAMVVAGQSKPKLNLDKEFVYKVACGFLHPDYSGPEKPNDISLLRLERPATLKTFDVTCLPKYERCQNMSRTDCYVTFFSMYKTGKPALTILPMKFDNSDKCKVKMTEFDPKTQFCASVNISNRANSVMNSGAPLICPMEKFTNKGEKKTYFVQMGLVNSDVESVISPYSSSFTRTTYYRSWIDSIVRKHRASC